MLQEFFYISSKNEIKRAIEIDNIFDTELYKSGNYFLTEEDAKEALKHKLHPIYYIDFPNIGEK